MTFLERIMQARYPDARVYRNAHDENWTVSIQVDGRKALRARAGEQQVQVDLLRGIINRLEPKPKQKRRLHWGRRR